MKKNSIDLSQFDDDFDRQQTEEREKFERLPDGKYQVTIDKVSLIESSTGCPMLKWTLRILRPRFINRLLWRNSVFTSNTLRYVKADLQLCGLDLERLSELPNHLQDLLDVKLEITKKTQGDNERIYFNRRLENTSGTKRYEPEGANDLVPF